MALQFACEAFTTAAVVEANGCSCQVEPSEAAVIDDAIDMSSDILAILSGFRITGVCERTVRPVGSGGCGPGNDLNSSGSERFGGVRTIPLPGPATHVTEVKIDGVVLDPSEYGLLDGEYLYRKVGDWPTTNDLLLAATEVGTFQVKVRFGRAPDFVTVAASAELACEIAAAFLGERSTLPPGITSANIQGAAVQVDQAARNEPSTLPAVARFLAVHAPDGRNVTGIWTPELSQGWNLVTVS